MPPAASPLAGPLAAWLSGQEDRAVVVERLTLASAGARRVNALFDAVAGTETQAPRPDDDPDGRDPAARHRRRGGRPHPRRAGRRPGPPHPSRLHRPVRAGRPVLPQHGRRRRDGAPSCAPPRSRRRGGSRRTRRGATGRRNGAAARHRRVLGAGGAATAAGGRPDQHGADGRRRPARRVARSVAGLRLRPPVARAQRARRNRPGRRSCTPTSAPATSSSARTACGRSSTGRPPASATRWRILRGRASGCGAFARMPARSVDSGRWRRCAMPTSAPAASGTTPASRGGASWAPCAGVSAWPVRRAATSTAASPRSSWPPAAGASPSSSTTPCCCSDRRR